MLINLTDVFTSEGKVRRESFTYEPGTVEYFGFEYPILSKTDAEITFQNIGNNRILLTGTMELDLEIPCDHGKIRRPAGHPHGGTRGEHDPGADHKNAGKARLAHYGGL